MAEKERNKEEIKRKKEGSNGRKRKKQGKMREASWQI
jgi:hypothetical protein